MLNKKKGFALIEVLIAITLITMLAAIVIIAVNPARQFSQGRDTQRWAGANSILNAVHQNMVDNNGSFDFSGCGATIMPSSTAQTISSTGLDLCGCLTPTYIAEMPYDPTTGSYDGCDTYDTGYTLLEGSGGRITIEAPSAELQDIIVTR